MSRRVDCVLNSSLVLSGVPYRVLVPDAYDRSGKNSPVLYLLHGLFGSFENWTELTRLDSYIENYAMIVVMPEGGANWYTDSGSGNGYESYMVRELVPEIDRTFRTRSDRFGRIIAGNSMGGYGAFKVALKYPDLFALAGSFSGAFHAPRLRGPAGDSHWDELGPSVTKIFGNMDDRSRSANCVDHILDQMTKTEIARLPYLYVDCGLQDEFISANREMAGVLSKVGAQSEYNEFDGGHDWQYWDGRIRNFLDVAEQKFDVSRVD